MFIYQIRYQKLSGIKAYNIMPSTLKELKPGFLFMIIPDKY